MSKLMKQVYASGLAALFSVALSSATVADEDMSDVSGYLGPDIYKKLEDVEIRDGTKAKRWIGPKLSFANYKSFLIEDIIFFPEPEPEGHPQVSEETLEQVRDLATTLLKAKVAEVLDLSEEAGPQVVRVQAAITGVSVETEGMKAYEVLPVTAIFGGIKAMTGTRDREVRIFLETKLSDSESGEVLGAGVRRLKGENLKGKKDQLTVEDMRKNIEQATDDAVSVALGMFPEED